MSSPQNTVRQRGGAKDKKPSSTPQSDGLMNGTASEKVESLKQGAKEAATNDWDYKLALGVITVLAFITRFWGISHPDQVVFDEVHFGKVWTTSQSTWSLRD
jgi:dolichyl-phosphate-mannose-protein mannosyltransferase